MTIKFSGGLGERETPVPIPNTEVKPLSVDGTARATVWESRSIDRDKIRTLLGVKIKFRSKWVGIFFVDKEDIKLLLRED